ncbi:MAG TPA: NADH-quinone oxidoreductase subunit C [Actinomycetota bacterium]|nr:NADH-quinone oxidoreductase subunit C [Actinomycetota bacterium]
MSDVAGLLERLRARFPDAYEYRGEANVVVDREELLDALRHLRDEPSLSFRFLSDVSATDWPDLDPRFWVVYHLLSMEHRWRVRVRVGLPADDPRVPSAVALFPTADWLEREVFDFFGVVFEGHPDLRRIELPEDWEGYPLRKDAPLGGVNTWYKGAFVPPPDQRGL